MQVLPFWPVAADSHCPEAVDVRITEQQHGKVTVLKPRGAIVGEEADHLGRQIAKTLQETGGTVVLDASGVPCVDSRGLEVLVDVTEQLIRTGQALKIAGANDVLREVLELTELASLFEQFDDVPAALGSVA
jgi:anti-anti-sigma factor